MRAFACPRCRALVFFGNSDCLNCGAALGYDRHAADMREVAETPDGRPCENRRLIGCNWVVTRAGDHLCGSCELTRVRPADTDPAVAAWSETEAAKRMLVAQLDSLGLPVRPRTGDGSDGLAFDLLSSAHSSVTTGHADGVITLDLAEGDDAHREAVRVSLREPYRTVLGHLRHEIGHYYWPILAEDDPRFVELFGDATVDYTTALNDHYGRSDDRDWTATHVSRYAAAHPWEDWAETFAQYLHIRDVLHTAAAWGVRVTGPDLPLTAPVVADPATTPVNTTDFASTVTTWLPLSFALNALNQSMGHHDLYPYLLPPPVLEKLNYVHDVVTARHDQAPENGTREDEDR